MEKEKRNEVSVRVIQLNSFDKSSIAKESKQVETTDATYTSENPLYDYDVLTNLYGENVYNARCINVTAHAVCGVGFKIERYDGKEADEKDKEYKKLNEFITAHSDYTGQSFTETMVNFLTDWKIFGDAYLEGAVNRAGEIQELYHLKSYNTRLAIDSNKKTKNRFLKRIAVQKAGLKEVKFYPYTEPYTREKPGNFYFRLSNYSPKNTIYGVPDYISSLISMSLMRAGESYNLYFLENYGMPHFAVIVENGKLTDEAFASLKNFLNNEFKGVKNAGKGIVLETGEGESIKIDIKELSQMPKDSFFRTLKLDSKDDIISSHGVPPRLVGVSSGNKLGDTTETKAQMELFQNIIISPVQARVEHFLNNIFKQGMKIENYKIKFDPFYIADPKDDAEFYAKMINTGVLEPDEARAELGYKPRKIKTEKSSDVGSLVKQIIELRKALENELAA